MNKKTITKSIIMAMISVVLVMALNFPAMAAELKELDTSKFAGKRIGTSQGSFYVPIMDEMIENPQVSYYANDADCAAALQEGKIDGFVTDSVVASYISSKMDGIQTDIMSDYVSELAFVATKDAEGQALVDEINAFLKVYKEEGKLEELQNIWINGSEEGRVMEPYSNPEAPKGKLTMAVSLGQPPFDYIKDGEIVGFNPALTNEFCRYAGYDIEYMSMDFSAMIPSVSSGKFDLASCVHTITEERKQSVLFTDPVALNYGSMTYKTEGAQLTVEDFAGKKIAVANGSEYVPRANDIIKDPKVEVYNTLPDMTTALISGKVDGILEENTILSYVAAENSQIKLIRAGDDVHNTAILAAKDENGEKLISEFNATLKRLKENGELDKIYDSWFTNYKMHNLEDYTQYPDTNGEIHIATEGMCPPFAMVNGDRYTGYEVELILNFCKEYGYRPVYNTVAFDGIIAGVTSGKYDIGSSAFTITEERAQTVLFSDPICQCWPAIAYIPNNEVKTESFFDSVKASFKRTFIEDDRWKLFADGIKVTLLITVLSIIGGSALGFGVHLLCRTGKKVPNLISRFIRWLVEGMPIVVFLMVLFYIIFGDSQLSGMWVATIGFTVIFACFVQGMLETGERAVDKGQYIAAQAMGYSDEQAFFLIILPQALKYSAPLYISELTTHIKATAVVGYIAVMDITKIGDLIRGMTYDAFFPLIAVAVLYFVMAGLLKLVAKSLLKGIQKDQGSEKKIMKGIRPL